MFKQYRLVFVSFLMVFLNEMVAANPLRTLRDKCRLPTSCSEVSADNEIIINCDPGTEADARKLTRLDFLGVELNLMLPGITQGDQRTRVICSRNITTATGVVMTCTLPFREDDALCVTSNSSDHTSETRASDASTPPRLDGSMGSPSQPEDRSEPGANQPRSDGGSLITENPAERSQKYRIKITGEGPSSQFLAPQAGFLTEIPGLDVPSGPNPRSAVEAQFALDSFKQFLQESRDEGRQFLNILRFVDSDPSAPVTCVLAHHDIAYILFDEVERQARVLVFAPNSFDPDFETREEQLEALREAGKKPDCASISFANIRFLSAWDLGSVMENAADTSSSN